jgi:hypothetical protein
MDHGIKRSLRKKSVHLFFVSDICVNKRVPGLSSGFLHEAFKAADRSLLFVKGPEDIVYFIRKGIKITKIVNHGHAVPAVQKTSHKMGSDKPGSSGNTVMVHKNLHMEDTKI